uniref:phosphomevalonate kinase n=1 Tax=Araucaria cunninghamii TaxID=56994 RepID=A0A0D6QWJ7_ARACU
MAVITSAPGKVLITGAYLVLEKPNPGIVLSTTARFYAIVKPLRSSIDSRSWAWLWTDVKLMSPQLSKEEVYKLSLKTLSLQNISSSSGNGNPFAEQAVQFAVQAAKAAFVDNNHRQEMLQKLLLQGLDITILGSNDFYSYRKQIDARGLPLTSETLSLLPAFSSINVNTNNADKSHPSSKVTCAPELAKTGLGSSAAMTTAVVAALLQYLGVVNVPTRSDKNHTDNIMNANLDLVHVVSQTAHCVAQGKIGSGFDVSAAVYGSQRYVRFSPEILSLAQWMDYHKDDLNHHAIVKALLAARQAMLEVRNLLRQIGEAAGVPIEPESQTHILDMTMGMEGVLLAGVPGAGGFDAIFAITLGSTSRDCVAHKWSSNGVLPLLVTEDPRGVTLEDGDPREIAIASRIHSINLE